MMPGSPRRTMHQSKPGVRRRRVSHPSIHFPRSVYLPSIKTGALGFSKFSLGAKKSSFAITTAPPSRSDARSISSVKSIRINPRNLRLKMSFQKHLAQWLSNKVAIINLSAAKESFFYDTTQWFVIVRGDFMAVVEARGGDGELSVGVPDDEIGVVANRDRAFTRIEPDLFRGIRAEPSRHVQERESTPPRLGPDHRQA